jgi:hypothetical protein
MPEGKSVREKMAKLGEHMRHKSAVARQERVMDYAEMVRRGEPLPPLASDDAVLVFEEVSRKP